MLYTLYLVYYTVFLFECVHSHIGYRVNSLINLLARFIL